MKPEATIPSAPLNTKATPFNAKEILGPAPALFTYYLVSAICTLPAVFIVLPVLWCRYISLKYKFDEEGVSMRWGIFFQRETILTYRRIQDIHVTRNLFERWLGISTVSVQTAAGSALPEVKLEGIIEAEALRDFLYERMRGAKDEGSPSKIADLETRSSVDLESKSLVDPSDEVTKLLVDIRDNLAKLVHDRERMR